MPKKPTEDQRPAVKTWALRSRKTQRVTLMILRPSIHEEKDGTLAPYISLPPDKAMELAYNIMLAASATEGGDTNKPLIEENPDVCSND